MVPNFKRSSLALTFKLQVHLAVFSIKIGVDFGEFDLLVVDTAYHAPTRNSKRSRGPLVMPTPAGVAHDHPYTYLPYSSKALAKTCPNSSYYAGSYISLAAKPLPEGRGVDPTSNASAGNKL